MRNARRPVLSIRIKTIVSHKAKKVTVISALADYPLHPMMKNHQISTTCGKLPLGLLCQASSQSLALRPLDSATRVQMGKAYLAQGQIGLQKGWQPRVFWDTSDGAGTEHVNQFLCDINKVQST